MLSVTVGTSRKTYAHDGRRGDIDLLLWPMNFSLAYVGCTVLEPFVAYSVEAGLRYSASESVATRLRAIVDQFRAALLQADRKLTVPFNQKAERGADGRILPEAPAYSPFMRHRRGLDLG